MSGPSLDPEFYEHQFDQLAPLQNFMNDTTTRTEPTRAEHLAWCKKRALEYCDIGDVNQAFGSMGSDLGKHPETANHLGIELGMMMLMNGTLGTPEKMAEFIRGFN